MLSFSKENGHVEAVVLLGKNAVKSKSYVK